MSKLITTVTEADQHPYKYLIYLAMGWVSALLLTTLTTTKMFAIGPVESFSALLVYPITYIFGDVFTEVYGYKNTRKIIWTGLLVLIVSALLTQLMVAMPPSPNYGDNEAFTKVFAQSPEIAIIMMISYLSGEFTNSYIMARVKVIMSGRMLWVRTTTSTLAGQLVDNGIGASLYCLLMGYTFDTFLHVWLVNAALCALYEFLATPLTYAIVNGLKKAEGLDVYDRHTNFNPFKI